ERLSVFGSEPTPCKPDFLLKAVDEVERCADGLAPVEVLAPLSELADRIGSFTSEYYYACYSESWGRFDHGLIASCEAALAGSQSSQTRLDLAEVAVHAARAVYRAGGGEEQKQGDPGEAAAQCGLIRDLFPRHRRPVTLDPAWRTSDVMLLARGIYDEKAL